MGKREEAQQAKEKYKLEYEEYVVQRSLQLGIFPPTAPCMPRPGPMFMQLANAVRQSDTAELDTHLVVRGKDDVDYRPGDRMLRLYARALRDNTFSMQAEVSTGRTREVQLVPGHIWGERFAEWQAAEFDNHGPRFKLSGPQPADVMLIGKMPWDDETREGRLMVGPVGEILIDMLGRAHIKGCEHWYVTNLVKFMPPAWKSGIRASWVKDCLPLLYMELALVRPKYILCLGAEAAKAVFGKNTKVGNMEGRVVPWSMDFRLRRNDSPDVHHALGMVVMHPSQVVREEGMARALERSLSRVRLVLEGERPDREEEGIDHRVCYSLEEAEEWAEEAEAVLAPLPRRDRLVALDLEWEGRRAVNNKETKDKDGNSVPPPSWVATIQVSWGHKQAICFVLRSVHGKVVFTDQEERPAIRRLIQLLNRFFRGKRLVGHFLNADLEFAQILGLKPLADCPVPLADGPDGRPPWELMRDDGAGWLDVGLMSHAVEETSPLGLEAISLRYTTAPRYDAALNEWREAKKKASEIITGYGRCDRDILTKYGNYDADVTRRAAVALLPLLSDDYEHHDVWESFWESMITQPVILEMMTCGIRVDRHRVDQLTASFMRARARVEEELREWARWPEFNMRSTLEVREFLYGEELSRKVDKNGNVQRIRPPDALCLHLTPLLDTSKPPRRWDDLVRRGQAGESAPSTNKMVLGIMAQDAVAAGDDELAKPLMLLRDQRFLDQALKQMLRVPKVATEIEKKKEGRRGAADVDNAEAAHAAEVAQVEEEVYRYHRAMPSVVPDDPSSHKAPFVEDIRDTLLPVGGGLYERDGDLWVYDDGIVGCLDQDGKVRTHLSPTADTGRWKSWRPNLQNGAKSRDADYERLLGDAYEHKMRSIFVPDDGKVFIDFDLKGAELAAMAILSGSKVMLDHCERGLLPQSDPRYYDIHCNIAKMVFKLDLPPLPSAFKEAGVGHLRNLAKTVIFGLAYGRGAKAIAFGAREQGVTISVEEVEAIIAQVFATYPELVTFFEAAASRATRERWLRHPLGRKRRFPVARMPNIGRDFERQAKNFPVQGMVASVVDRGLAMMQYVRDHELRRRDLFDMLLQIHDAGLIQAPYANVEYLVDEFIPYCMVQSVPVYPADLEGKLLPGGPYFLGLEISVESPWGEPVTQEFCDLHGIRGNFPRGKPKKAKEKENGARRRVIR